MFDEKYDRDILIEIVTKRFEYAFESLWKLAKEILYEEGIECATPLTCLKELWKLNLVDNEDEEILPLMVKKRNLIVHIYNEDEAKEIFILIKNVFINTLERLYNNIKLKLKK